MSTTFDSIGFKHVFREANFVANAIDNLGHSSDSLCIRMIDFLVRLHESCSLQRKL